MLYPSLILILLTLNQVNVILSDNYTTENLSSKVRVVTVPKDISVAEKSNEPTTINIEGVMNLCNESFRTTFEYLEALNKTGKFPDEADKTPMCFIRCVYENVGLIKDNVLNKENIQKIMWPATGDSIEVCQQEGKNETNLCLQTYLKAKCLTLRSIVDGKNELKT